MKPAILVFARSTTHIDRARISKEILLQALADSPLNTLHRPMAPFKV